MEIHPLDASNQRLADLTHPSDYKNPDPANPYNLVVLGAGTAGLVTAAAAAGLGARVALVEKHLMGGDCLNYGCVPSKALIRSAEALGAVKDAAELGVHAAQPSINFKTVMERMRGIRADIAQHDSVKRFCELGIDVFLGKGMFTGKNTLDAEGAHLRFKKAVIATGASAFAPPIPGLKEAGFLTNETLFSLETLPQSLAVIGAGPIGCEMAQAFQRMGADVSLIDVADRILPREDPDVSKTVEEQLRRDGVALYLGAAIESVEPGEPSKNIILRKPDGSRLTVASDCLLAAAGRKPNVEAIGLENAGVHYDPHKGIQVDDTLRTSNPRIYAAGDVCSRYQFTHAADFLARTVVRNALFPGASKASRLVIPWCTYTVPQAAHVGLTPEAAAEQGVAIDTYVQSMEEVDRALLDGDTRGFVKIHTRKGSDRIVGATIVDRNAGDMIGELAMAITNGISLGKLANVIHPYPTRAEAMRKVGDAYNRSRLTPLTEQLLSLWMKFLRKGS